MKIGWGVSELWGVKNRSLPLTSPKAYTTACTTVQAVINILLSLSSSSLLFKIMAHEHEDAGTKHWS